MSTPFWRPWGAFVAAIWLASTVSACGGVTMPGPVGSGGTGTGGHGGGVAGSGQTGGVTGGSGGAPDACVASSDCAWGEIDHELLARTDCPCLFGCPFVPLSTVTIERRKAQYVALCTPQQDGKGNPCGIDDCVAPPPITCVDQKCVTPPTR